jgi:1-deoxy-D-xylulose-5-phosphate reductoisomerase
MTRFAPDVAAVVRPRGRVPDGLTTGADCLRMAVEGADLVINVIVGSAGLEASVLCRDLGIRLALANKESLVVGGPLLEDYVDSGMVIPIDSEHSTIFRCIAGSRREVESITLTASGGSARRIPIGELDGADATRILDHPTWDMGARITVDSATMVNKAFEVIEARWLFGSLPVGVVIHPQSIVHSLVRMKDGAWKALMGQPDMRVPIQYALAYPDGELTSLMDDDPLDWGSLEFEPLDHSRYPAFSIVTEAGIDGKTYPAAANAADEIAVEAFLEGRIGFGDIHRVIRDVLETHVATEVNDLADVLNADREARVAAGKIVGGLC